MFDSPSPEGWRGRRRTAVWGSFLSVSQSFSSFFAYCCRFVCIVIIKYLICIIYIIYYTNKIFLNGDWKYPLKNELRDWETERFFPIGIYLTMVFAIVGQADSAASNSSNEVNVCVCPLSVKCSSVGEMAFILISQAWCVHWYPCLLSAFVTQWSRVLSSHDICIFRWPSTIG